MGEKVATSGYTGSGQAWPLSHACKAATGACPPKLQRLRDSSYSYDATGHLSW
ncbi:hypothetical protein J7J84_07565 [bacterium]|nr:hypothetical protein [bacterium]